MISTDSIYLCHYKSSISKQLLYMILNDMSEVINIDCKLRYHTLPYLYSTTVRLPIIEMRYCLFVKSSDFSKAYCYLTRHIQLLTS